MAPAFGELLNLDSSKPEPPLLGTERVQAIYSEHCLALERFLVGVLRDEAAAADALQTTFTRLIEKGHLVQQQDSMKSWLFRVAFNEAMLIRRKETTSKKHAENVAWKFQGQLGADRGFDHRLSQSVHHAIQQEDIKQVRAALDQLPLPQRVVVKKRIYEGLKFREIADELNVPLGTVLARMQAGLKKLKPILKPTDDQT
ncbi:RNA polymerase sigma factor [Mariniblastus sp.]|nr:RNA polymerase sigma factor [Mariniblastus sp.]